MWHSEANARFFELLLKYAEQIAIEVGGHEHVTDIRYHSTDGLYNSQSPTSQANFHNILIAPGVTPWYGQNPGVAVFDLSDDGIPSGLKMEFIDMISFEGLSSLSYEDLSFKSMDFAKDHGLNLLTPESIFAFR